MEEIAFNVDQIQRLIVAIPIGFALLMLLALTVMKLVGTFVPVVPAAETFADPRHTESVDAPSGKPRARVLPMRPAQERWS